MSFFLLLMTNFKVDIYQILSLINALINAVILVKFCFQSVLMKEH